MYSGAQAQVQAAQHHYLCIRVHRHRCKQHSTITCVFHRSSISVAHRDQMDLRWQGNDEDAKEHEGYIVELAAVLNLFPVCQLALVPRLSTYARDTSTRKTKKLL